jgi:Bifunctional DNA primase/polymerase, N-terminal
MASSMYEYYGEPESLGLAATTRFFQVAAKANERFSVLPAYDTHIQLIPLDPGGKRPAKGFMPSRHTVPKTREALALLAATDPDANVGINSSRAPGALTVMDCDEPGVVERYERETGRRFPLTYTTQTRPHSAPYKTNHYYMSTEYSVQQIKKQVTDVTHVAGYDLKGCGGWGYVRAEGCVRDGEPVAILHDVPIVPIPDSLVNWMVADITKARAHNRALRAQKSKTTPSEPEPEQEQEQMSRPFVVPRLKRNLLIKSRVRTWKNTGMSDDEILPVLINHIRTYFEDPEELLTKDGIRKLRATIRKTKTLGATSYINWLHSHPTRRNHKPKSSTLATMRELFKSCPAKITSSAARAFFSVRNHADELRLYRLFRSHGYVLHGSQGSHDRVWIRALSSGSSPFPIRNSPSYLRNSLSIDQGRTKTVQSARGGTPHHRKVRVSMRN